MTSDKTSKNSSNTVGCPVNKSETKHSLYVVIYYSYFIQFCTK